MTNRNAVADDHVGDGLDQRHEARLLHATTSSIGQQLSCESSQRMRGNQWDHAIATEAKPVHPVGQPISASTNCGFKRPARLGGIAPSRRRHQDLAAKQAVHRRVRQCRRPVLVIARRRRHPHLAVHGSGRPICDMPRARLVAVRRHRCRPVAAPSFQALFVFPGSHPGCGKLSVCGVGHIATEVARFMPCLPASCDGVGFVCRFSLALARGRGPQPQQFGPVAATRAGPRASARGRPGRRALGCARMNKPFALVRRADFRRREEACRKAVAHADQSSGDFGETEAEMMGDVHRARIRYQWVFQSLPGSDNLF